MQLIQPDEIEDEVIEAELPSAVEEQEQQQQEQQQEQRLHQD